MPRCPERCIDPSRCPHCMDLQSDEDRQEAEYDAAEDVLEQRCARENQEVDDGRL